jgi:hypothetical protein
VDVVDLTGSVTDCRFATEMADGWPQTGARRGEVHAALLESSAQVGWVRNACDGSAVINVDRRSDALSLTVVQSFAGRCGGGTSMIEVELDLVEPLPATVAAEIRHEPDSGPMPTAIPMPSFSPILPSTALDCERAQEAAARTVPHWPWAPRPAEPPASGWIAAWAETEASTTLDLIDPMSGKKCELNFDFGEGGPFSGGELRWSPDGRALAMFVNGREGTETRLYVWSAYGLAGPLLSNEGFGVVGDARWSPDGSSLVVTQSGHNVVPGPNPIVWILGVGGERRSIRIECEPCWAQTAHLSPDGRQVALTISGTQGTGAGGFTVWKRLLVGSSTAESLDMSDEAANVNLAGRELEGWVDDSSVLLERFESWEFKSVDVTSGLQDDPGPLPVSLFGSVEGLSPDGSSIVQGDREYATETTGRIVITNLVSGERSTVIEVLDPWVTAFWSPDGEQIGFVAQGIGIALMTLDGADPVVIADGAQTMPRNLTWQPLWPLPDLP